MTINTIDVVIYTAWFVLPGYLISSIIKNICLDRRVSDAINLLKNIGYSLLNLGLWCWIYILIYDNVNSEKWYFYCIIAGAIILTSTITGLAFGLIRYYELLRKIIFKVFKIQIEKPIPTAWDNIFSSRKYGCWVIVSLGNGKHIGGRYSTKSHASSDMEYRDIYLEETYEVSEDGWKKTENTEGVWIPPSEIKKIEFIGDQKNG